MRKALHIGLLLALHPHGATANHGTQTRGEWGETNSRATMPWRDPLAACYQAEDCQTYPCPAAANDSSILKTSDLIAITGVLGSGTGHKEFLHTMAGAQQIIQNSGLGCSKPEAGYFLHTTLKYFCCHPKSELGSAARAIEQYVRRAPQLRLHFESVSCNQFSGNHTHFDFFAVLTANSSAAAEAWVAGLETALVAVGVPVNKPRRNETPFHSTMTTGCLVSAGAEAINTTLARISGMIAESPSGVFMASDMAANYMALSEPLRIFIK
jgi:hypothetical protein